MGHLRVAFSFPQLISYRLSLCFLSQDSHHVSTDSFLTHRQIWLIAGPMILANLSTPLLGMVDTAVVGHLSEAHHLGAVAIGSMIFTFVFWGFGFLRMATTGLTSQAFGESDQARMQAVFLQSVRLALAIALAILLLQVPIRELALWIVSSSGDVEHFAAVYFDIRIWSAPATLINYAMLGWLIGVAASRSALLLVIVINSTNIVFDLLLVNGLGMQADGVALASVIAEYCGLLCGLVILRRYGFDRVFWSGLRRFHGLASSMRGLDVHFNVMVRTFALILCFGFFTTQGARQGETILAANAVLLNFITFMAFVMDGFANATEVLSGKAVGRRDRFALWQAVLKTGFWSVLMASLFMLVYWQAGPAIIQLLTGIPVVAETAMDYRFWLVAAPLIAVWSYLFDGLFVGATLSREMRNTMLISAVIYLISWYLLQPLGNHGLWAALLIFLGARGVAQAFYLPAIFQLRLR